MALKSSPRQGPPARRRIALFVALVAAGSVTGLYWRAARAAPVVRAAISLNIEDFVQPDGAISVSETFTLDPNRLAGGELIRRIPTPGGISVAVHGASDGRGRPLSALGRPESSGNVAVRVGVKRNTTFVLRYALVGAVRVTDAVAIAAVAWLDGDNELALDHLTASIQWPGTGGCPATADAFIADRRLGGERIDCGVRFHSGPVQPHVVARGRVSFDRAGVEPTDQKDGTAAAGFELPGLGAVGRTGGPWDAIGVGVGVAVLVGWALLQRLAGVEHEAPSEMIPPGPPSGHTPAEVGWLLRFGEVRPSDLTATVIDLSSRGYLIPHRRDGRVVVGRGRPPLGLHTHEQVVLDWLFPGIVRECDLEARNADIRHQPELWSVMWERFVDEVRAVGRSNALVERPADSPVVLGLAFAGLAVLALGIGGIAASHVGWFACVVAGSVVLAWSTAFARRSPEGARLAAHWEAFGHALRDQAAGAVAPTAALDPHALAYAVALHESDAAEALIDAHQTGGPAGHWPTQLIEREVQAHVDRWRTSYLVATSIKGEPSERWRAALSLRARRRSASRPVRF